MLSENLCTVLILFSMTAVVQADSKQLDTFDLNGLVPIEISYSPSECNQVAAYFNAGKIDNCYFLSFKLVKDNENYFAANYLVESAITEKKRMEVIGFSKQLIDQRNSSGYGFYILQRMIANLISIMVRDGATSEPKDYSEMMNILNAHSRELVNAYTNSLPLIYFSGSNRGIPLICELKSYAGEYVKTSKNKEKISPVFYANLLMEGLESNLRVQYRKYGVLSPELQGAPEPWFALDILEQEWRYDPTDGKVMFLTGKAYALMGDNKEAEKWLKMSIKGKGTLKWMRDSATKYLKSKKIPDLYARILI